MARPQKEGLDYFPLDVDMFSDNDDKTSFLEAKYGLEGIGIIIKLLQRVYGGKGYYKQWGEREVLLFSKQISVDMRKINELISDCINENFFSQEMFEKYGILTSSGIQKRYFKACTRRNKIKYESKYLLVEPEEDKKPKKEEKPKGENVFAFFQKNIGLISPFQAQFIGQYIDDGLEEDMIKEIITDSIGKTIPWDWIKKVLENSLKNNIKTLEQYNARKVEFKRQVEAKSVIRKQNNVPNKGNFDQRKYDEDFLESLYE